MIEVRWTDTAADDLESIHDFVAHESPATARLVTERLVGAVEVLREFPDSGRIVPERADPTFRDIIREPYRIVYERAAEVIFILTVFHSARRFPESLDAVNSRGDR